MVNVIFHQHICIQLIAKSFLTLCKKIQIALTVPIVIEDRLALIAATHDVIERTGKMYPRLSGHKGETIV